MKNALLVSLLFSFAVAGCASSSIPQDKQKDYALLGGDAHFGSKSPSYIVMVDQETFHRSAISGEHDVLPGRHTIRTDVCVENNANLLAPFCKTHTYIIDAQAGLAYIFENEYSVKVYDRFDRKNHLYDLSPTANSSVFLAPDAAKQDHAKQQAALAATFAAEQEEKAAAQAVIIERRRSNLPLVRKVGTRICQDQGNGVMYVGYVEGLAEEKVQIRISDAFFMKMPNAHPGGFSPSVIWDSPLNWDLCE
jgi:hypothetical protein